MENAIKSNDAKFIKSTLLVAVATLCSRIAGYIRDAFFAFYFGTGSVGEAFIASFRFMNLFRVMLGEGGFSSAFVPIFSKKFKSNISNAISLSSNIQSILLLTTITLVSLSLFFIEDLVKFLTPGFVDDQCKFLLTISLSKIIFIYAVFICLSAFYGSMLNSIGSFLPFSITPIILNVSLILSLYFLNTESKAHDAAYGVLISGLIELSLLIYFMNKNMILPKIQLPRINDEAKKVISKAFNCIISAGINQINIWVNVMFASSISGALSYIYYTDRLIQLPLAIIGTSAATVLLPLLSTQKDKSNNIAINFVLFFIIPSCFALFTFSDEIVRILLERGKFDSQSTYNTATLTHVMSIALPAYALIKIFNNSFYSMGDTKTPMLISIITALINAFSAYFGIKLFGYLGIGIATVISSWCNLLLLSYTLRKYNINLIKGLGIKILLYITCAFFMTVLSKFLMKTFLYYGMMVSTLSSFFIGGVFYIASTVFLLKILKNFVKKNESTKK
ncbi:Peptidoglycan biosynthesis protein MurJ [Candidatus Cyrtobacter comes]|uniref:Probable lipid II flippase MurJ n=1 Tax=Candidatus Cyrtobacter comes TaxID=675776 RepID=A0ABU5L749_9RICK|nr:murein biosynthesis integral membrane protein MurJ [Candidatus Cyrtobacter comes]MDZ5761951.1 Peptidoglycan biosynthesis protein MurJ [Candidatus Cyrtobacter comes]